MFHIRFRCLIRPVMRCMCCFCMCCILVFIRFLTYMGSGPYGPSPYDTIKITPCRKLPSRGHRKVRNPWKAIVSRA